MSNSIRDIFNSIRDMSYWITHIFNSIRDISNSIHGFMLTNGVISTPSDAILWAIYTDLHGFANRGALLESGQDH